MKQPNNTKTQKIDKDRHFVFLVRKIGTSLFHLLKKAQLWNQPVIYNAVFFGGKTVNIKSKTGAINE